MEAAAVEMVMDGVKSRSFMAVGEWCGSGVSAPVNTPSPESLAHSMVCVSAACEIGHRGSEASQRLGAKYSPPDASPPVCPPPQQLVGGSSIRALALPLLADQGLQD